jgi:hypothetical protein
MKDKAGIELHPGDLIVYGHALGRCAGLQYGVVLKATPDGIMVRGVDADWSQLRPRLLKKAWLKFSERVLRVTPEQVHHTIGSLLYDAYAGHVGESS